MTALEQQISTYFGVMQPNELETIGSLFRLSTLKKGDLFLQEGRRCDKMSFIQSGFLRIFALSDGREITQWVSTPGYFVTDLAAFMFETPARWSMQALTDVYIYTISRENYKKLPELVPSWPALEKLFLVKCFTIMEDRIFSHLSMTAEERYQFFFDNNRELFNQVPLQYIASMLGMTAETFSRVRKKQLS